MHFSNHLSLSLSPPRDKNSWSESLFESVSWSLAAAADGNLLSWSPETLQLSRRSSATTLSLTAWPLVKCRKSGDWLLSTVSPLFYFSVFQRIPFSQSIQRSHFQTPHLSCSSLSHVVQPVNRTKLLPHLRFHLFFGKKPPPRDSCRPLGNRIRCITLAPVYRTSWATGGTQEPFLTITHSGETLTH